MHDKILAGYMKDFEKDHGLQGLKESELFEAFSNFCVFSRHQPDSFELEDVMVGGGGDWAIDGLGILVNDHLVRSEEDVEFFKGSLRRFDVKFVFVQSKTSSKFDVGEIGKFIFGVQSFFTKNAAGTSHDGIAQLKELSEYIYESSIDMDASPSCHLYYVTSGRWEEDPLLMARLGQGQVDLEGPGLFSNVSISPVDGETLKGYYRAVKHKVVRELQFDKHTILPQIDGIKEAYIGIVTANDYLGLICDDDGQLNRRMFYDNVRDFQGQNPVNREIEETVQDADRSDRFALLNNGITIVARDANKVGAKFKLKDFQVVNGCQTSHVLFMNRERLGPDIFVPVKIVVTENPEVINQVIQGTNRQTEVKLEAFESLQPFQKKLEEFYETLSRESTNKVYYERRSKQYEHLPIEKSQIITLATQIKCFVAMFLNEPHSTHRYYGELLKSYRNKMFLENHSPWPYYTSGQLYRALHKPNLPGPAKHFRMQVLMLLRLQQQQADLPYLNSKGIEGYCVPLLELAEDVSRLTTAVNEAGVLIQRVLKETGLTNSEARRTRAFTRALIDASAQGTRRQPAEASRQTGVIERFNDFRGFGFIRPDAPGESDVFLHVTEVEDQEGWHPVAGARVEFTVVSTHKGPQARAVTLLTQKGKE